MGVRRVDFSELKKPVRQDNGWLRTDAVLTRVGIFEYRNPDGSSRRELRPPEEVFHQDSLSSFEQVPVTIDHPAVGILDSHTTKEYQRGSVSNVHRDGAAVAANVLITDATAIDAAERGGRSQISCGYTCDCDETPGMTKGIPGVPDGSRYDAVQKNIRGNHVALVQRARAGESAVIRLDDDGNVVHEDGGPGSGPHKGEGHSKDQETLSDRADKKTEHAKNLEQDRVGSSKLAEAHRDAQASHEKAANSQNEYREYHQNQAAYHKREAVNYEHSAKEEKKKRGDDFAESDHPRAEDGKFGEGSGDSKPSEGMKKVPEVISNASSKYGSKTANEATDRANRASRDTVMYKNHDAAAHEHENAAREHSLKQNHSEMNAHLKAAEAHHAEADRLAGHHIPTDAEAGRTGPLPKYHGDSGAMSYAQHATLAKTASQMAGDHASADHHAKAFQAHTDARAQAMREGNFAAAKMHSKAIKEHASQMEPETDNEDPDEERMDMKTVKIKIDSAVDFEVPEEVAGEIKTLTFKKDEAVALASKEKARADAAEEKIVELKKIDVGQLVEKRLTILRAADKMLPSNHGMKLDSMSDLEVMRVAVVAAKPKVEGLKDKMAKADENYVKARFDAISEEVVSNGNVNLHGIRAAAERSDEKDDAAGDDETIDLDARRKTMAEEGRRHAGSPAKK